MYAYSTVSQLGYMFLGVGVGAFSAGIWHVMTHAFFKGLLFLGAGAVMHGLHGELDYAPDGRPAQVHADHRLDAILRFACDLRCSGHLWIFQ